MLQAIYKIWDNVPKLDNTVMEVNKYCENIIVVLNRVKKDKMQKYKQSIEALKGLGKKNYTNKRE